MNANGLPRLVEVPSLDSLVAEPSQIDGLPLDVLKALWVDVRNLEKVLTMRLLMAPATVSSPEDRILRIKEASIILGTTVDHLYRHHDKYPFAFKDGDSLRFSWLGIQKWIRARQRHG